ncbi:MAG: anti-sigma factor [Bacillota bacterium]|nr:anti-sigma factor [Bacillota bacterium]
MKTCVDYAEKLALFYDGELSEAEKEEVLRHAEECPECSRLLKAYKMIFEEAESLEIPPPESLHGRIMKAVETEKVRKTFFIKRKTTEKICAAAVILLMLGGVLRNGELLSFFSDNKALSSDTVNFAAGSEGKAGGAGAEAKSIEAVPKDSAQAATLSGSEKGAGVNEDKQVQNIEETQQKPDENTRMKTATGPASRVEGSSPVSESATDGENGASMKFGIAAAKEKTVLCPDKVPFEGEFAFVMVASGSTLTDELSADKEAKSGKAVFYLMKKDEKIVSDTEDALIKQGFEVTYFNDGKDYIDSNSKEFIIEILAE